MWSENERKIFKKIDRKQHQINQSARTICKAKTKRGPVKKILIAMEKTKSCRLSQEDMPTGRTYAAIYRECQ